MGVATNRIRFLARTMSQSAIARTTGIPRSTVGYVVRGIRTLPAKYWSSTRSIYARSAYASMRSMGIPARIARRLRYRNPTQLSAYISQWSSQLDRLTRWQMTRVIERIERYGFFIDRRSLRQQIRQSVTNALSKSRNTWDEIMNYGQ